MIRTSRFAAVVSSLVMLLTVFAGADSPAQAQVTKPFRIVGIGVAPDGLPLPGEAARPHWIVGVASHLGFHFGDGSVQTDTATPNPDGTITGMFGSGSPFEFRGRRRNKLVCHYGRTDHGASQPGDFELTIVGFTEDGTPIVEALFIAEFVPVPGASTGKFAGVTGSWIMFAYTEPFVLGSSDPILYAWEGEGSLTFQKKK